jgi:hypothetical protein
VVLENTLHRDGKEVLQQELIAIRFQATVGLGAAGLQNVKVGVEYKRGSLPELRFESSNFPYRNARFEHAMPVNESSNGRKRQIYASN